jgi:hypothetical protein
VEGKMKKVNGGSAFPAIYEDREGNFKGMTLRDYFAGQALVGFIANNGGVNGSKEEKWEAATARISYEIADAMIQERSKDEKS